MADEVKENGQVPTENGGGETMTIDERTASEAIPAVEESSTEKTITKVEKEDVADKTETQEKVNEESAVLESKEESFTPAEICETAEPAKTDEITKSADSEDAPTKPVEKAESTEIDRSAGSDIPSEPAEVTEILETSGKGEPESSRNVTEKPDSVPEKLEEFPETFEPEPEAEEPQNQQEPLPETTEIVCPASETVPEGKDSAASESQPQVDAIAETKTEVNAPREIDNLEIKKELNDIINEIDETVAKEDELLEALGTTDETQQGEVFHTWRPKGKYDLIKTEIEHGEVVPIAVDDVKEPKLPAVDPVEDSEQNQNDDTDGRQNEEEAWRIKVPQLLPNGELGSPIEIPEGIPLLARILPKEEDSHREKIPLERLFTPATDSGDITPRKKKAFASSDFYAPDHPTIDDQLQLAQRISGSLLDQCNKTSKGQAMYEKRKQKSVKWIHQEGQIVESQFSEQHFEAKTSEFSSEMQQTQQKAKPAMKLVMNPKGVQDINTIESHYQQLMEESNTSSSTVGGSTLPSIPPGAVQIPASPEIAKDLINDMQSPTGKGAALFAKRKKRMDKFIIDETNVQKTSAYQQEQQGFVPTEPGLPSLPKLENFSTPPQFNTSTTTKQSSSSYSSSTSVQSNKKKSVQERDKEQKQIMESFLKNRESTMKIVKSPWEAMLETGSISNAFEINQQQTSSLKTSSFTSGVTSNKNVPSWLEMPKPVPMSAPVLKPGVFDPVVAQPSSFGAKTSEPVLNAPTVGFSALAPVVKPTAPPAPAVFSAPAPPAPAPFSASAPAPFSAPAPAAFASPVPTAASASPAPTAAFSSPAAAAKAPASQYVPKAAAAPMTPAQRAEMEERRKSGVNFNLAASGWGTYNAYYRPTSFASS